LTISGAISLAVSEINAPDGLLGSRGHSLSFIVAETYGEEAISIRQTASLWTRLTISGAISLAVSEINAPDGLLGSRGHSLTFIVAETYGDSHSLTFIVAETYGEEAISIKQTASLWTRNVSAYIGPQETCTHEGRMAAAFDIVMISYFCTDYETSDKTFFPTFARTRPPISQISKSVAAVLLAFQWSQVAFFYLNSPEYAEFGKIASSIIGVLESVGILVTFRKWWDAPYHHGYSDNPFVQMIRDTYAHVRIYVILGHYYEHLGLMVAMEEMGLFDKGEYFVVGVDIEQYDSRDPEKYLRGMLLDNPDPVAQAAYRSYIGVLPSAARGYENFTEQVNYYCEQPPFNFVNPLKDIGANKIIRPEAAYLYDAVYLYANALVSTMEANESTSNTTAIMQRFFRTHYHSILG
ncbi:receptor-type guanylate cyclase Gyc76C-like, partial [Diaphorina citri]|uniref:Receptor-type guanylate cyclase Gyc76C-like n=1 Tax=Diaphorina citri TaxID=121845 RepID=A0A3Q0JCV2_DIACI